eukprot:m.192667 g.192667  ORF g.192667 m.192667 type:complete len:98 (-) comp15170_c0_seq1:641-934(-)
MKSVHIKPVAVDLRSLARSRVTLAPLALTLISTPLTPTALVPIKACGFGEQFAAFFTHSFSRLSVVLRGRRRDDSCVQGGAFALHGVPGRDLRLHRL